MSSSVQSFRQLLGTPPSTATPNDSVLLIIDAQNEYATGLLKTENVSSTRKAIAGLLSKYRAAGGALVHIVHDTPDGAPVFTPGKDISQEFEEVKAKDGEKVVHKQHPGAFAGTELKSVLDGFGKKKLVLTGYMAHVCVSTTARQAAELGYEVVLAEDAIGDRDIPGASATEVVKMVLLELADAFGTVLRSEDLK
ncbi:MAG: hypothetical protein Q9227_004975 [Pyrenula ochraceoflavens]